MPAMRAEMVRGVSGVDHTQHEQQRHQIEEQEANMVTPLSTEK